MKKSYLAALVAVGSLLLAAPVFSQQIVQSRGYDSRVDYLRLADYGPWDDRNYKLTREDLALLPEGELERRPGVPLFYRIEMLKTFPALRDPVRRYPKSAWNKFVGTYGGMLVDGRLYRHVEVRGSRIVVDAEEGVAPEAFEARGQEAFVKAFGWKVKRFRLGAETAVKFKPGSSSVAVAGINNDQGAFGQAMGFTTDGGLTWQASAGAVPFADSCCDPTVDWSSDGAKVYTATLQGSEPGDVFVYRSGNDGGNWNDLPGNSRTELGESGADKEYLHVDSYPGSPFRDRVYLCWHTANVQRFAFSTDQAESFTKRNVSGGNDQLGIGCDLTSDKAGRVYYFWPAFLGQRILVRRSVDGGSNFEGVRQVARTQAAFDFPIPAMDQRSAFVYVTAAVDLSDGRFADTVYAAWTDTYAAESTRPEQNHSRVRVAFSRDGGLTWTVRSPHRTGDRNDVDRFHPWLAVDPGGVVHLIYYDTERSGNRRGVDVVQAFSRDGGQSWTRRRVTNLVSQRVQDGFQFGDYNGLDAAGARLLATWTGTRNNRAVGESGSRNN